MDLTVPVRRLDARVVLSDGGRRDMTLFVAHGESIEDLFESDRLHNNAEGYRIRAEAVRPHVEGHAPATPEPLRVLRAQEAAWNRGDIDGFMEGYDRSESITFSSDRGVTGSTV